MTLNGTKQGHYYHRTHRRREINTMKENDYNDSNEKHKQPLNIQDWYVEWANSLDSAGGDSGEVAHRLDFGTVRNLVYNLHKFIRWADSLGKLKKHLFYGQVTDYEEGAVNFNLDCQEDVATHENIRLLHAIIGIADEAGELAKAYLGRVIEQNVPIPESNINIYEEEGDLLWYQALLAKWAKQTNFVAFKENNYRKLTTRYPEGAWTQDRAINRDLSEEDRAMREEQTGDAGTTVMPSGDVRMNAATFERLHRQAELGRVVMDAAKDMLDEGGF